MRKMDNKKHDINRSPFLNKNINKLVGFESLEEKMDKFTKIDKLINQITHEIDK